MSHCRRRPLDAGNGINDPQQPMVMLAPEGCAVGTEILSGALGPWSAYPGPVKQTRRDVQAEAYRTGYLEAYGARRRKLAEGFLCLRLTRFLEPRCSCREAAEEVETPKCITENR